MTENELQERMKHLYQKQRICLNIQKLLIVLSIVFFKGAFILLTAHVVFLIVYSNILCNRATSLARTKYPYVPMGRVGKGIGWDPFIITEARRHNDNLTVKLLKFNYWTVYCFAAAMIGNVLMWLLAAALQ